MPRRPCRSRRRSGGAAVAFDSGSVGDRLLPAPALGGGGGRVPRPRRALTGGRVRALRARARSSSRGSTRKPHHTSSWHDPCARARTRGRAHRVVRCALSSSVCGSLGDRRRRGGRRVRCGSRHPPRRGSDRHRGGRGANGRKGRAPPDLSRMTPASSTSPLDVRGEALAVSQFTLVADSKRQKGTDRTSPRPPGPRSPSHCTSTSSRRSAVSEFRRRRDLRREDGGHDRERWAGDDRARCVAVRTGRLATGRAGCHASADRSRRPRPQPHGRVS